MKQCWALIREDCRFWHRDCGGVKCIFSDAHQYDRDSIKSRRGTVNERRLKCIRTLAICLYCFDKTSGAQTKISNLVILGRL